MDILRPVSPQTPPPVAPPANWWSRFWRAFWIGFFKPWTLGIGIFIGLTLTVLVWAGTGVLFNWPPLDSSMSDSSGGGDAAFGGDKSDGGSCNVTGIEVRGCLYTYDSGGSSDCDTVTSSEDLVHYIEDANDDPDTKAIVLEFDSGGGMPSAAEEVVAALKHTDKPTIAWVRSQADSAAYWIASAAGKIIAGETSEVGSIGVTSSYLDNSVNNSKEGYTYHELVAGKYKDLGSPDKPLTADEQKLIQRDLEIIRTDFVKAVAENRKLPLDKVEALADGSAMLGQMAKDNGLVDEIGTKDEVWADLESAIGEKPEVCWPQYSSN